MKSQGDLIRGRRFDGFCFTVLPLLHLTDLLNWIHVEGVLENVHDENESARDAYGCNRHAGERPADRLFDLQRIRLEFAELAEVQRWVEAETFPHELLGLAEAAVQTRDVTAEIDFQFTVNTVVALIA